MIDLNDEKNTRIQIANSLKEISSKLESLNLIQKELQDIKENIKHFIDMKNS